MKKGNPHIDSILTLWKEHWPKACSVWSPYVKLREPIWCLTSEDAKKEGLTGSFAMIRLNDHRIVIDLEEAHKSGVENFSLQILAHEIGHHVYTPANLHDNAVMLSRIRWALPGIEDRSPFVSNLYSDFLINDTLHRIRRLDMASVYQQINKKVEFSNLWMFFMRTYEYLWKLKRGTLATDMKKHSANLDADASLTATLIRSYAKNWLDGAGRFAALMYPYIIEDKDYQAGRGSMITLLDAEYAGSQGGVVTGMTAIDPEAMAGAIDPRQEAANGQSEISTEPSVFGRTDQGGDGPRQRYLRPGVYVDLLKQVNPNIDEQELINNYYREIALPHLISFPLEKLDASALTIPEGTDTWDISDPLEEIDWLETAITSPQIFPGYNTRKRLYGPDDSDSKKKKPLDVYIGIDCSGSMMNPRMGFSWPVLAATVIALSALRAGAKVMGCLSGEPGSFLETKDYSTSEKEILTVLTSYLGTGYAYGIPRLNKPFQKKLEQKSHIVIVTDDDIFSMLQAKTDLPENNWQIIEKALHNAGGIGTIVLHSRPEWHQEDVKRLKDIGWRIHYVTNEQQLLEFAAAFSEENYHSKNFR